MINKYAGRTMCMQVSIQATHWPDDILEGLFTRDGEEFTGREARETLNTLKAEGYTVVPCGYHECDETGHCSGEPTPD